MADQSWTKQHVKTSIFLSYLKYLRVNYPHINLEQLCDEAGLPLSYIENQHNWVSIEFDKRFVDLVKLKTGNSNIAFEVGKYGVRKDVLGSALHFFITYLVPLEAGLRQTFKYIPLFNKLLKVETLDSRRGYCRVLFQPDFKDLTELEQEILAELMPEIIESTRGYLMMIPTLKELPPADVRSGADKNISNGHVLEISYKPEPILLRKILHLVPLFLGIGVFFLSSLTGREFTPSLFLGITTTLLFALIAVFVKLRENQAIAANTEETLVKLDQRYRETHDAQTKLERKYAESKLTNQIVNTLSNASNEDEALANISRYIVEALNYDRVIVFFIDVNGKYLQYKCSYGDNEEFRNQIKKFSLPVEIESNDPFKLTNSFKNDEPVLIPNVKRHISTLADEISKKILLASKSNSFVCVPISGRGSRFGLLLADSVNRNKTMTTDDVFTLSIVGKQLAIAMEKLRANIKLKEALEKELTLKESYSRFVPWETLNYLNYQNIHDVKLGDGIERKMTVMFSDIRDFTEMCETMSPTQTLRFLNSYFGRLSPTIRKHKGTIDKFIGDCIMAIFTTPEDAIAAAIEIQRDLIKYNIERRIGGRKPVDAGIGICQGPLVVGPVGFDRRLEITVLSDTVNIASRLDGMCKDLKAQVLVSGIDESLIVPKSLVIQNRGEAHVKGKKTTVPVLELIDPHLLEEININELSDLAKAYVKRLDSELGERLSRVKKVA